MSKDDSYWFGSLLMLLMCFVVAIATHRWTLALFITTLASLVAVKVARIIGRV